MKIRPVGAELFHALRGTDMTKLIVALRNFANEPRKNNDKKKMQQVLYNFTEIITRSDLMP